MTKVIIFLIQYLNYTNNKAMPEWYVDALFEGNKDYYIKYYLF